MEWPDITSSEFHLWSFRKVKKLVPEGGLNQQKEESQALLGVKIKTLCEV